MFSEESFKEVQQVSSSSRAGSPDALSSLTIVVNSFSRMRSSACMCNIR